jgi:hypothetical protein
VLARTALARLAGEDRTVSMDRRSRHRAPPRRRSPGRRVLHAAAITVAVLTVVWGTVALGPAAGEVDVPPAGRAAEGAARAAERPNPVTAAVELTHRRARVLTGGDADGLLDVVRRGSSAHAADVALLEGLGDAGVRLEGLVATEVTGQRLHGASAEVTGASPTPAAAARVGRPVTGAARAPTDASAGESVEPPAERVDVSVTSGLSAHRRLTPAGVVDVPAQPPRTVVLTLVWTSDGWRVEQVRDP